MIRVALDRPVSTLIAAATIVTVGGFSLYHLPVSFLPEIERPRLELTLRAETRSQDEMLHGLTIPLERRLLAIRGVHSVRSRTTDGQASVVIEGDWQADTDRLLMDVSRRLEQQGDVVPDEHSLSLAHTHASPIVEVAVLDGPSAAARTSFVREVLLPELARIPGAGRVEAVGLAPLRVVVYPDAVELAARNLTASDIVNRLREVGEPTSAGRIRTGAVVRPLVVRESVKDLGQLENLLVSAPGGNAPLKDLARIALEEVADGSRFSLDGAPGILLRVYRSPGANAVSLARRLGHRVDAFRGRAPAAIRLEIVSDRSREVVGAMQGLGVAALTGILLGTLVLRFLLGTWKPTVALAVVIPASILTSFAAFHFQGMPLNVVSIAGLALAAGMLVDNSIVVLESIESSRGRGERNPRLTGTRQVAVAVIASAVTTIVVFLPLLYLRGLARAFFGEQAFAIVSALAASLLFSLTLTPVLAGRQSAVTRQRSPGLRTFLRAVDPALRRPGVTAAIGLVLVVVSLTALLLLPRELFPPAAESVLRVRYELSPQLGTGPAEKAAAAVEAAVANALAGVETTRLAAVRRFPATVSAESRPGGEIDVELVDPARLPSAQRAVEAELGTLPDVRARVAPRPSAFLESAAGWAEGIEVVVTASSVPRVEALAETVSATLESATGKRPRPAADHRPREVLALEWDQSRLAALDLDRVALESQVRASLERTDAGKVSIPGVIPEILIEASLPGDPGLLSLGPVTVGTEERRVVPLGALARLEPTARRPAVYREDGRPARRLVLDPDPGGSGAYDALTVGAALAAVEVSADETVRAAGQGHEVVRSFTQLGLALALSILLVFLTLAAVYESVTLPLLILATVPTAAGGAFAALAASGQSLNVMSFLGLILLGGIVVNNAIVLLHRVEQLRADGVVEPDALRAAIAERYRPIVMTTLTTLIGMLPLAILGGEGVELRRALATAVLGGLLTGTFASLVLVPALHAVLEPWRRRPVGERP